MSTVGELVDRVLQPNLLGGGRVKRNRLDGSLDGSTETVVLEFDTSLSRGTVLEVELERMYVWSWDAASKTATVERGFEGTTKASHGDDTPVVEDPVVSRKAVFDAMLHELAALPGEGLFRLDASNVDGTTVTEGFDLAVTNPTDVVGVHAVYGLDNRPVRFRAYQHRDTADFPSGWSIRILEPRRFAIGSVEETVTYRVIYRRLFTPFTAESDDVESVCGLPGYAHMILVYGAAARIAPGWESRRAGLDARPGSRPADEVQQGANAFVADMWRDLRDAELAQAKRRQQYEQPMREQR